MAQGTMVTKSSIVNHNLVPSLSQNFVLKSYTDKHRPPKDKQRKLLQVPTRLDCYWCWT